MNNTNSNKKNKVGRPFIPAEERKDYKITIRVDKDFKNMVDTIADERSISVAELIRDSVDYYIKNYDED